MKPINKLLLGANILILGGLALASHNEYVSCAYILGMVYFIVRIYERG